MPGDGGDSSTWAILVAAGSGERLGADRPKAFVALGGRVLLAESLERLDSSAWIDAVVVAVPRRLGGGRDRARRGARRLEGRRGRHGRRNAGRVRPRRARRGSGRRARRPRARRGPSARRRRGDRAGAGAARRGLRRRRARACRSPTPSSGSREASSPRPSIAPRSSPCRRRRRSPRPRCARAYRGTDPIDATDCASLVEARGGRIRVVDGDLRLLKITTPADLALVESWL